MLHSRESERVRKRKCYTKKQKDFEKDNANKERKKKRFKEKML